MNQQKTIVVTGATGFVGAYVTRDLLRKGYAVKALRHSRAIPSFIPPADLQGAEWIEADILDAVQLDDILHNVYAVIHAAANVSFQPRDRQKMYATNIDGTANVVNVALDNRVARFVHVSSVASLGRTKNIIVNEKQAFASDKKNTHYGISKQQSEMEVWRGIGEGLPAVIVNPSTILGYGDWNETSTALFRAVWKGLPWYTHGVTGFVDVEDVSRAIISLMESEIEAERFIISAENWSFTQLLNALADNFGKKHPRLNATPFLSSLSWRIESIYSSLTGRRSLITRETARVAHSHTEYDHSKLLQAVSGFHFTPLADTIRRACIAYAADLQR